MNDFSNYKIYSLGESAVIVDFGNLISIEINDFVINLANQIDKKNFKGFVECVPAYSSLTIFYDVFEVRNNYGDITNSFQFVKNFIENTIKTLPKSKNSKTKTIEIPVSFDKEFALDLEFVAESNNLKPSKVIEIFLSKTYRVFMLGFLPGFAYMGELDESIASPRKQTPRTKVPKGSVGIAGMQTGIYPFESPGGWQIIGKTDVKLFTPNKAKPTLLQTGDTVKFTELK
ncbi:MAG: 5-oxoprolinase subunit PxpB [Aridibacter sp.]